MERLDTAAQSARRLAQGRVAGVAALALLAAGCSDGGDVAEPAADEDRVGLTVEGLLTRSDGLPAVLLRAEDGRAVALDVSPCEATGLYTPIYEPGGQVVSPRPLTHDLILALLDSLGLTVAEVRLDLSEGDSVSAAIVLAEGVRRWDLPAYPADALNLALRAAAPIRAPVALVDGLALPDSAAGRPASARPAGESPARPGTTAARPAQDLPDFVGVRVAAVATTPFGILVVLLVDEGDHLVLPVFVDPCQGLAIHAGLQGIAASAARPHALIRDLLRRSDTAVSRLSVHDLRDEVYIATLYLRRGDRGLALDCRPSDGIALALLSAAPMDVAGFILAGYGEDTALYPEIFGTP